MARNDSILSMRFKKIRVSDICEPYLFPIILSRTPSLYSSTLIHVLRIKTIDSDPLQRHDPLTDRRAGGPLMWSMFNDHLKLP